MRSPAYILTLKMYLSRNQRAFELRRKLDDKELRLLGFLGGSDGKESTCNAGDLGSIPGSWRREWQHTPVLLPGEFYGQSSLADYSPWGHKESDTIERLTEINNDLENVF